MLLEYHVKGAATSINACTGFSVTAQKGSIGKRQSAHSCNDHSMLRQLLSTFYLMCFHSMSSNDKSAKNLIACSIQKTVSYIVNYSYVRRKGSWET